MTPYRQPELVQPEDLPPRLRWQRLFDFLPAWPDPPPRRGRRPVDRNALLKACVYQRLTRRRFLTDLRSHLSESPPMLAALGFNSYGKPPPTSRGTPHTYPTRTGSFVGAIASSVPRICKCRATAE